MLSYTELYHFSTETGARMIKSAYSEIQNRRLYKYVVKGSYGGNLGNQFIHAIGVAALRGQFVLHADEAPQQQSGFLGVQCDVVPSLFHITRSFRFHHTTD